MVIVSRAGRSCKCEIASGRMDQEAMPAECTGSLAVRAANNWMLRTGAVDRAGRRNACFGSGIMERGKSVGTLRVMCVIIIWEV